VKETHDDAIVHTTTIGLGILSLDILWSSGENVMACKSRRVLVL